jgi:hypothetical protein
MKKSTFHALVVSAIILFATPHSSAMQSDSSITTHDKAINYILMTTFKDLSNIGFNDLSVKMYATDNKYIGYSQTQYLLKNKTLQLQILKIVAKYRNQGAGGYLFKQTMEELKKAFPDATEVDWQITPFEIHTTAPDYKDAVDKLKSFYLAQGALVIHSPWSSYPTGKFILKQ